mmetsp:Transcript_17659/g.38094  ORF Transcript_17659/g.38094 Transcript_17659/m.38094 type:complete len:227 (-) Transcript_17659:109-789(-)
MPTAAAMEVSESERWCCALAMSGAEAHEVPTECISLYMSSLEPTEMSATRRAGSSPRSEAAGPTAAAAPSVARSVLRAKAMSPVPVESSIRPMPKVLNRSSEEAEAPMKQSASQSKSPPECAASASSAGDLPRMPTMALMTVRQTLSAAPTRVAPRGVSTELDHPPASRRSTWLRGLTRTPSTAPTCPMHVRLLAFPATYTVGTAVAETAGSAEVRRVQPSCVGWW